MHCNEPKPLSLSVIVPLYNEQESIPELLTKIQQALSEVPHEVILVDDGSIDGTVEVARRFLKEDQKIVVLDSNYGQSVAVLAGLENSKNEVIAIMDGDGQIDPCDIGRMYKLLIEGDHELIQGVRFRRRDPLFKMTTSKYANKMIRQVLRTDVQDAGCSAKVFRRSVLNEFPYFNGFHRLFAVIAQKIGIKVKQVLVNHSPRKHGSSNYGLGRTFHVLRHVWALSNNPVLVRENLSYEVKEIICGT